GCSSGLLSLRLSGVRLRRTRAAVGSSVSAQPGMSSPHGPGVVRGRLLLGLGFGTDGTTQPDPEVQRPVAVDVVPTPAERPQRRGGVHRELLVLGVTGRRTDARPGDEMPLDELEEAELL